MGYIREKNETHISGSGESPILYIHLYSLREREEWEQNAKTY